MALAQIVADRLERSGFDKNVLGDALDKQIAIGTVVFTLDAIGGYMGPTFWPIFKKDYLRL